MLRIRLFNAAWVTLRDAATSHRRQRPLPTRRSHRSHGTRARHPVRPAFRLVQTGIPPALTAKLLVTGEITERGVMMPEALAPDALMNNFSKEGLRIFVEKREVEELR